LRGFVPVDLDGLIVEKCFFQEAADRFDDTAGSVTKRSRTRNARLVASTRPWT
jgi:hypothetical protein